MKRLRKIPKPIKQIFIMLRNFCSILLFVMIVGFILFCILTSPKHYVDDKELYSSAEDFEKAQEINEYTSSLYNKNLINIDISEKYVFDDVKYVCRVNNSNLSHQDMFESLDELGIKYNKNHIMFMWESSQSWNMEAANDLIYLIRNDGTSLPIFYYSVKGIEIKAQTKEINAFCNESLDGKVIFDFQLSERP